METILLDGKLLRDKKYVELKTKIASLKEKGIQPHLAVVQVGNNPASTVYVGNKIKACAELDIISTEIKLDENISWETLQSEVDKLNNDANVDGILIQLPLPKHLSNYPISTLVAAHKDADGIHPLNQGILLTRHNEFAPIPCTPNGMLEFIKEYNIDLEGKNAVVIGRSNIVGRPISYLLANENATVSMLHTKTRKEDYNRLIKEADIIISATGFIDPFTPEMVKPGVIIIDAGIIRGEDGKLRGDVQYREYLGIASHITPVPGGVGPMTVTMLMENVVKLAEFYRGKK